jgi:FHA domain-containing protein/regulatory Fis family protein
MYRLVAIYGEQSLVFKIPEEEACLGSAAENDLVLRVRGVSRRHALIRRCPGGIEMIDLGSKNGLLVEGRRVERTILTPGLRVQIGGAWLALQELSTPASTHTAEGGTARLRESAPLPETTAASAHDAGTSASTYADALRLAYHLDRIGAGTPGLRDELLARFRVALGATMLLGCERLRREKTLAIRESDGASLSEDEALRVHTLTREPRAWSRDEVRLKRSGVFLLAGRGNLFLVAKFSDEPCAREGWRKDFLRFLAERLLGKPPGIDDTKKAALRRTLALTGGNKSETARLLKISRQTVYNFLRRPS